MHSWTVTCNKDGSLTDKRTCSAARLPARSVPLSLAARDLSVSVVCCMGFVQAAPTRRSSMKWWPNAALRLVRPPVVAHRHQRSLMVCTGVAAQLRPRECVCVAREDCLAFLAAALPLLGLVGESSACLATTLALRVIVWCAGCSELG